jgi:hypothetical protein
MDIPLQLSWHKEPVPELTYETKDLGIKARGIGVITGDTSANALLKEKDKQWIGQWHINDIKMTGIGPEVPVINGNGTLTARENKIIIEGKLSSNEGAYKSIFRIEYFINEQKKSYLQIIETALPWNGGIVSTENVTVPFDGMQSLSLNLKVQQVSLASIMQRLTGKKTLATGAISGLLPVRVEANGAITVRAGKLIAEQPGIIAMPPESIPGDNEKVDAARSILKNFHYSLLSIDLDQDKNNKLSALMKLEGNNPDVYGGRAAKLNVHLSGDVLNFFQQNLLILTNPQKLLLQGKDGQP